MDSDCKSLNLLLIMLDDEANSPEVIKENTPQPHNQQGRF